MSNKSFCRVKIDESEQIINISFKYSSPPLLITERFFHFSRKCDEEIGRTLKRLAQNINNAIAKHAKKQKIKVNERIPDPPIDLIINGESVDKQTKNKDAWLEGSHLVIDSFDYTLCLNMPSINTIRLPKSIMAGFLVYPYLKLDFCALNTCKYVWYKQKDSVKTGECSSVVVKKNKKTDATLDDTGSDEWTEIGTEFYYNTSSDDIGKKLKLVCIPSDGEKQGFDEETISANCVEAGPGLCPFEDRHCFTRDKSSRGLFRFISYNILADLYADSDFTRKVLFPYCPPYALEIDYRKQLLIKELIGYNGDIYCMQEVDRKVYESDLQHILSLKNFDGFYSEKSGEVVEGLACFYDKSKFELCHEETVILAEQIETNPIFSDIFGHISANEELVKKIHSRTSVLQCVLLRCLECSDRAILLGNTHLYYHPNADNIRLIQSYVCVKYIENEIAKYRQSMPELNISPILCGDFNSCPEFGVYQLYTENMVAQHIADWNSNADESVEGIPLSHTLSLSSACGKPQYTNYTSGFDGCLDYIFYDVSTLSVSEVIPFPSHQQVTQHTAIPNIVFPSDHLALISTLKFI